MAFVRSHRRVVGAGVVALVVATTLTVIALGGGDSQSVDAAAGDELTTTTSAEPSTTTTEAVTTTTVATTTTAAPTTTSTTAAPITTPPAPPTTMPSAPPEFAATVRGEDQGPDYYAIFYGTTYGAGGGFAVFANCRPGTLTVTVIDDGMIDPLPPGRYPLVLMVEVDDNFTPGSYVGDPGTIVWNFKPVSKGTVITSPVHTRVRIWARGPSDHDVRIRYDCRG